MIQVQPVKVADLIPYANNARTHSDEQIAQIAASIKEFGWTNPILIDGENGIIAGHGRLAAARKLGMDEIPAIQLDGLSKAQKKALILADNKLALNAGWDDNLVAIELGELKEMDFDITLTGFSLDEFNELQPEEITEGLTDEDNVPEVPSEPITKLGDVWLLGRHRLMCGDSTSIDAVDTLMAGHKVDMVFTDPPYNIDYIGVAKKHDKIKNDKMSDPDFVDFLTQTLHGCETMYVCCSWHYAHLFREALVRINRSPKAMIIWDKINPAQHLDKYFKQHEIIFYYGDYGGQKTLRGDVWQVKRQKNTVHPTMKPVELIEMALQDQPSKKIVADYFGGSGSTLIACEKTARNAYLMELDPKYCDVIIKRWQDFTGKEATLEATGETFNRLSEADE